MVTFFFSGACAQAGDAKTIAATSVATAPMNRIMFSSSCIFFGEFLEPQSDLRGVRGVVAHLLGFDGEVGDAHVEVHAAEEPPLVERLVGEQAARRLRAHARDADAAV